MAVEQSDIKFYKSDNLSGGDISANEITDDVLNNVFDNVSGDEAASGAVEYRKIFVKNENASAGWEDVKIWVEASTDSEDDELDISTSTNLTGESPTGSDQDYVHPTSKAHADVVDLGTVGAGDYKDIWIRRTVQSGASAYTNNSGQLKAEGDTAA